MIKDVKSYFNTVTARLSNAFNIQEFDLEDEAQFWALAAEHLSRKKKPSFRDMAEWIDMLFRAPLHLVYIREGDHLRLFRQHIISKNLEFLYELVEEEAKSAKNKQQVIRDFEDRLANIESKIRYREELTLMGTSSFTIGKCQHIPLFKDDDFWGIYCVGPYVQTPEAIVPRLSIITRILTAWLNERYNEQTKLQLGGAKKTENVSPDTKEEKAFHIEESAYYLLAYLVRISSAQAGILATENEHFELIQQAHIPQDLQGMIKPSSANTDFSIEKCVEQNRDAFNAHRLSTFEKYVIGDEEQKTNLYVFFSGDEREGSQRNQSTKDRIIASFNHLMVFRNRNRQFVDQLMQTYYLLLRDLEQRSARTNDHTPRLMAFCSRFSELFGLNDREKAVLLKTARFHDIGYVGLNETTMDAELRHPLIGKKMLEGLSVEPEVALGVATHHEWIDGSGTPAALKAAEIPWTGKIVGIFEFVVQFIEGNKQSTPKNDEQWKKELVEALVRRTGKQFDMILIPTVVELIKNMSWQECCTLGAENE